MQLVQYPYTQTVFSSSLALFVPVLKNGGEASVVQQALYQLRQDSQFVELESLLAFFAVDLEAWLAANL